MAPVTSRANATRSTASAAPAGTRVASAARMHQRAEPPHLLLEQADGVVELVAAERIAADQLGERVGLVHGGRPHRPHLVERDGDAELRRLPRGFAPGQAAADDVNHERLSTLLAPRPLPRAGGTRRRFGLLRCATARSLAAATAGREQRPRVLHRQRLGRRALRQRRVGRPVGDVGPVAAVENPHAARPTRDARRARATPWPPRAAGAPTSSPAPAAPAPAPA